MAKKRHRRVVNPEKYLSLIKENEDFYIGVEVTDSLINLLKKIGFSKDINIGETVLPAIFGNVSEFNAEGKENPRKDLPKETVYYPREWTLTDWGGYEHSGVNYMPYERWQRELVPPPSLEFQIAENDAKKIVISKKFKKAKSEYADIKHAMNLFFEIFDEFQIFKENLTLPVKTKIIRLNWELLPPGINPWSKVNERVKEIIEKRSVGEKAMIADRFKKIESYKPNQIAIGLGGFTGYLVFGYKDKSIYLLESLHYGNATYVLGTDWEVLSQMTKAEILKNNYQKDRIIHSDNWSAEIDNLFK